MKKLLLILVLFATILVSCGRKGALYLPEDKSTKQEEGNKKNSSDEEKTSNI